MEWTITIRIIDPAELMKVAGVINDIASRLNGHDALDGMEKPIAGKADTKNRTLKDPDTGEIHIVAGKPGSPGPSQPLRQTGSPRSLCLSCGNPFEPKRKDSKYCSERCAKAVYQARYFARKNGKKEEKSSHANENRSKSAAVPGTAKSETSDAGGGGG